MSHISNVVAQSLRANGLSQYERQAAPVIRDLETAAARVAQNLRVAARNAGVASSDVEEALISSGLVERPTPPPAPRPAAARTTGSDTPAAEALARIEQTLGNLVGFAQRHGFRA